MTRNEAKGTLEAAGFVPGRDEVTDKKFAKSKVVLAKACAALEKIDAVAWAKLVAEGAAQKAPAKG